MEAQLDKSTRRRTRIAGLKLELRGRINGATRSQKKTVQYGRQDQQHTQTQIEYATETIITKYGTLGLKVQSMREQKPEREKSIIKMSKI